MARSSAVGVVMIVSIALVMRELDPPGISQPFSPSTTNSGIAAMYVLSTGRSRARVAEARASRRSDPGKGA